MWYACTSLGRSTIWVTRDSMLDAWLHHIFGSNDSQPEPTVLLEHLQSFGFEVTGKFRGDDLGWFSAEIAYTPALPPLQIERFLTTEDDIRNQLNRWAAWLETLEGNAHAGRLMQQLVATTQLFALRQPILPAAVGQAAQFGRVICEFLAHATDGIYSVHGHGLFATDGALLVDWDGL